LHLGGRVLATTGKSVASVTAMASATVATALEAETLGHQVASELLRQGAGPMLERMRNGIPE